MYICLPRHVSYGSRAKAGCPKAVVVVLYATTRGKCSITFLVHSALSLFHIPACKYIRVSNRQEDSYLAIMIEDPRLMLTTFTFHPGHVGYALLWRAGPGTVKPKVPVSLSIEDTVAMRSLFSISLYNIRLDMMPAFSFPSFANSSILVHA